MNNRRFRRREPIKKAILCLCGTEAKLVRHRNYPFGRKSEPRSYISYICRNCRRENPLIKPQEVKL